MLQCLHRPNRHVTITPFGYDIKWDGDVVEEEGFARVVMERKDKTISGSLTYNPNSVKRK